MKQYCVDSKLAKELKDNGFPQKCFNEWCYVKALSNNQKGYEYVWDFGRKMNTKVRLVCSAPTTDEILKELPKTVIHWCYELRIMRYNNFFEVSYGYEDYDGWNTPIRINKIENKKLSNALAKLWIYLKKEGYLNA